MRRIIFLFSLLAAVVSCTGTSRNEAKDRIIYVTIQPLKSIVEEVVGNDFEVRVLVPAGASPESFEPTAKQLSELGRSRYVVGIGLLDFEQNLTSKLNQGCTILALSEGIKPIAGSCSHCGGHHTHGIDPHIWTSPAELRLMVENLSSRLMADYPDSVCYRERATVLTSKIDSLDSRLKEKIEQSSHREFAIYHPAFSYLSRHYNIEQVAIESEGKEPSAKRIAQIIEWARARGVTKIFYQSQFPASCVEVIASDIGAESITIDPLADDIMAEIERFTNLAFEE